jgi:predicted RNA-binding Zn-ribbon protein involved in translation (DUF1610 family)
VRATLCTSVPQGANHFCGPSDLLSTTTTCFSQLNASILLCSSCGQNLIQFATPCRLSASTVCLTCTFAEPQNSLPKSGHEHYHDSLNIAYIISHINTEFLDCFLGGLPALDTFPRFTCPQIIPHKLAFLRLAHLCTPCTDNPCSNCSKQFPGCSFQRLLSKYASRTNVLLLSKKMVTLLSFVR